MPELSYAVEKFDFDIEEIIKRSEQQIFKVANQKILLTLE